MYTQIQIWSMPKYIQVNFHVIAPVGGVASTSILYYYCWDKGMEDLININTYMCTVCPLQENLYQMYVLSVEWVMIEILIRRIYLCRLSFVYI